MNRLKAIEVKLTYSEISIVPADVTEVRHRSECDILYKDGSYPLITAPMSSVVSIKNYKLFKDNHITPVIPRTESLGDRIKLATNTFVALSLNEFDNLIKSNSSQVGLDKTQTYYICIDIANGHMKALHDSIRFAKEQYPNLVIMSGNVASPGGYVALSNAGCDYVRVGIGGGSACFVDGTKIKMKDGSEKNIEDIKIGDIVKTLEGYNEVTSTFRFETDLKILNINNEIKCTEDHEFYVIEKINKNLVNESNIKDFGKWIKAKDLDKNKHFLIKII